MPAVHDAADTQSPQQTRGHLSERTDHVTHVFCQRHLLIETAPSRMSVSDASSKRSSRASRAASPLDERWRFTYPVISLARIVFVGPLPPRFRYKLATSYVGTFSFIVKSRR